MAAEGSTTKIIPKLTPSGVQKLISSAKRPYGLKCFHDGYTLPLEKVDVSATILQDFCCEVTVQQTFRMPSWGIMRPVIWAKSGREPKKRTTTGERSSQVIGEGELNEEVAPATVVPEIEGGGETTEEKVKSLLQDMELPGEYVHKYFMEEEGIDVGEILSQKRGKLERVSGANLWESKYNFPLPPKAAIFHFEAQLDDGAKVIGLVKQKNEAKRIYHDAVKNHQKAFLMEQKMPDVFSMSIGNIYPRERVTITIKYVCELDVIDNDIRLTFPMHLCPRYGATDYGPTTVDYPVFFDVDIHTNSAIEEIKLPDEFQSVHSIENGVAGDARNSKLVVRIDAWSRFWNKDIANDFFFYIKQQECPPVSAMLERSLDFQTEVLRLNIRKDTVENWIPSTEKNNEKFEIIFLVDKSGSMNGTRMKQAKSAMQLLLRSLPEDCYFQLLSYERNVYNCFSQLLEYNEESFDEADRWIKQIRANGGTDILSALSRAFSYPRVNTNYARKIILLTDGDVRNVNECISCVKNKCAGNNVQVHTLGVGGGFNEGLCRGIAEAGDGQFEGVRQESDINAAVIRLLEACVATRLTNPIFDLGAWGNTNNIIQVPRNLKYLPVRQRTNIYFVKRLNGGEFGMEGEAGSPPIPPTQTTMNGEGEREVSEFQEILAPILPEEGVADLPDIEEFSAILSASLTGEPETIATIHVNTSPIPIEGKTEVERTEGNLVHRLMAKARLDEIVNRESAIMKAKSRMTKIGERYNLVSSETSFVAVHQKEGEQLDVPMNILQWQRPQRPQRMKDNIEHHEFKKKSAQHRLRAESKRATMLEAEILTFCRFLSTDLEKNDFIPLLQRQPMPMMSSSRSAPARCPTSIMRRSAPVRSGKKKKMKKSFGGGRHNLLGSVRSGNKLKKAPKRESAAKPRGKMALQEQLALRLKKNNHNAFYDDDDEEESSSEAWSEEEEQNGHSAYSAASRPSPFLSLESSNISNNFSSAPPSAPDRIIKTSIRSADDRGPARRSAGYRRPARTTPVPAASGSHFDQFIKSQKFNGCFEIDLNQYKDLTALVNELNEQGLNENVVKTILALYILKSKYAKKEGEWMFVAKKARKFLQKQKIDFNFKEWINSHLGSN